MHRIEETIARGICIGCGACAAATNGAVKLTLGRTRLYEATLAGAGERAVRVASAVCPFSDESPNEDALRAPRVDALMTSDSRIGTHSRTFAGRVRDENYLRDSSSGGLASWLTSRLLDENRVDSVISVGRMHGGPGTPLFEHGVAVSAGEIDRRKSQYYATTMAEALAQVKAVPGRYVIVGIPCFIRAARALCRVDPVFDERITFFVGLVCGHYKTHAFAESLAWQAGVHPSDIQAVDFRVKRPDSTANDYDFAVTSRGTGVVTQRPMREMEGGNWGHSAFQPEACNFCDDVVGETADVSFGDAWLPEYVSYPLGTNVVVSRNREIDDIFDRGIERGEIDIFGASVDDVVQSQAGGFRHRREGLAVRLADDIAAGLSVPKKRVSPEDAVSVSARRARLIRQRRLMARLSHRAFATALRHDDLDIYLAAYRAEAAKYRRIDLSLRQRVLRVFKRAARCGIDWVKLKRVGL